MVHGTPPSPRQVSPAVVLGNPYHRFQGCPIPGSIRSACSSIASLPEIGPRVVLHPHDLGDLPHIPRRLALSFRISRVVPPLCRLNFS